MSSFIRDLVRSRIFHIEYLSGCCFLLIFTSGIFMSFSAFFLTYLAVNSALICTVASYPFAYGIGLTDFSNRIPRGTSPSASNAFKDFGSSSTISLTGPCVYLLNGTLKVMICLFC